MSVILAMRTNHAVVVASDSQYVSPAGKSLAPYDKTLLVDNSLLVCFCGLMAFSGSDTRNHLQSALKGVRLRPIEVVHSLGERIAPLLQAIDNNEVGFKFRRLDVIAATRNQIASVGFFPVVERNNIRVEHNVDQFFLVAGADNSVTAAKRRISQARNVQSFARNLLVPFGKTVMEVAIPAGGDHPLYAGLSYCCGPVNIRSLPK